MGFSLSLGMQGSGLSPLDREAKQLLTKEPFANDLKITSNRTIEGIISGLYRGYNGSTRDLIFRSYQGSGLGTFVG